MVTRNSHDGGWSGEGIFRGSKIKFAIDAELWDADPNQVAMKAFRTLNDRWPEVLSSLTRESLTLYNQQWRDPAAPPLSEADFLQRLSLDSFSIGSDTIFASFADGDLFAGHSLPVALVREAAPHVTLEG